MVFKKIIFLLLLPTYIWCQKVTPIIINDTIATIDIEGNIEYIVTENLVDTIFISKHLTDAALMNGDEFPNTAFFNPDFDNKEIIGLYLTPVNASFNSAQFLIDIDCGYFAGTSYVYNTIVNNYNVTFLGNYIPIAQRIDFNTCQRIRLKIDNPIIVAGWTGLNSVLLLER